MPGRRRVNCYLEGAWLWARRQEVVSGLAASALHGANWVDDDATVELIWRNARLTVEYDGDQHRSSRPQFVKDVERLEYIRQVGWTHITVLAEHRSYDVIRRVRGAWDALKRR